MGKGKACGDGMSVWGVRMGEEGEICMDGDERGFEGGEKRRI
jgi:hypothetical protein